MAPYNKRSKRLGTEGSHIPQHCPMLVKHMSALYSYGPILLWPYLVMAIEVPTFHNIAPIAMSNACHVTNGPQHAQGRATMAFPNHP